MSAKVTVSIRVDVDPLQAFEVFTRDIGTWWHRDARYQFMPGGKGFLRFEPGEQGRLVEESAEGSFEVGKIVQWEPGVALGFTWQGPNFLPGQITKVSVKFKPSYQGTRIVLEHSGWENLPKDHPVRHGMPHLMFMKNHAAWWEALLFALKKKAELIQ